MAEKVGDFYGLLGMRVDSGSFATANRVLGAIKTAMAAFVGFKLVQGIAGAVEGVVELGGHLNDASVKTGVAAETLQEYGFVASQAGGSLDQVIGALGKLNKGLGEVAATGKGPTADALKELGIGLKDPIVTGGDLNAIMLATARKFETTTNAATKTRIAIGLFGKSGIDMIPVLSQGAGAIEEMKKKARDLGVVIDNEGVKSLDDFGDSAGEVAAGWQGIKNQATLAILPILKDMMPGLISAMKDAVAWTKDHKEEIREFFTTLGRGLKIAGQVIVKIVEVIAKAFKIVGTAIGQAIGWIVTRAMEIGAVFSRAWDFAKSTVGGLIDGMKAAGNAIALVFNTVADKIKAAFKAVFDWVAEKVQWLVDKVKAVIDALDAGAKRTLNRLGIKPEDQTTGAKAAATVIDASPVGAIMELFDIGDASTPTTPTAPSVPSTPDGQPLASNIDVGGIKIDVHGAPGQDVKQLAALVGDAVDERMSQVFRHAQADEGVA